MTKYYQFCECANNSDKNTTVYYRRYCSSCTTLFCGSIVHRCPELIALDRDNDKFVCKECARLNRKMFEKLLDGICK